MGLGDFTPRNDPERLFTAFVLAIGVLVFLLIINNFNDFVEQMRDFNKNFDEEEDLMKFFDTLKNFNHGWPLDNKFKNDLETFFRHKWTYDKNNAFSSKTDKYFLDQLPDYVKNKIFSDYSYYYFLHGFHKWFCFERFDTSH